jgi:hypothetical protein
MGNLSAFLAQNAINDENIKYVASKRFVDDSGKAMEWEITAIDSDQDESLRKACTKRVPVPGKRGQFTQETDYNLYLGKLAAACTVFPNLNDSELQNSYGVMGSDALLKKMLKPGEYSDYLLKVQEVNGFDTTLEDAVEEAKNL